MDQSDPPKGTGPKKVREAPPPARELSGQTAAVWIHQKRTSDLPVFRSDELRYLPKNVQDAIELARIEADREFRDATSDPAISERKVRELRVRWLFTIVLGFCLAASEEIRQGRRNLAQVVQWREELFNDAANSAGIEVFRPEVRDELRRSVEWGEGERLLEHAAKAGSLKDSHGVSRHVPETAEVGNIEARKTFKSAKAQKPATPRSGRRGRRKGFLDPWTEKVLKAYDDLGRSSIPPITAKLCTQVAKKAAIKDPGSNPARDKLHRKISAALRRHRTPTSSAA